VLTEVLFAGLGGQGVHTAGLILAEIAIDAGMYVTWMPSYEGGQRGFRCDCVVKMSEGFVTNPTIDDPDVLVAVSRSALDFVRLVKPSGIVLMNCGKGAQGKVQELQKVASRDGCVRDETGKAGPTDLIESSADRASLGARVVRLDCDALAEGVHNPKGANLVMLGSLVRCLEFLDRDRALGAIRRHFAGKGKGQYADPNDSAFLVGFGAVAGWSDQGRST
jgi:2-oxoglutarate ferredoxin oxidoreductase subunit gamma